MRGIRSRPTRDEDTRDIQSSYRQSNTREIRRASRALRSIAISEHPPPERAQQTLTRRLAVPLGITLLDERILLRRYSPRSRRDTRRLAVPLGITLLDERILLRRYSPRSRRDTRRLAVPLGITLLDERILLRRYSPRSRRDIRRDGAQLGMVSSRGS